MEEKDEALAGIPMAVDLGTGCVGSVIVVVLGDIEGIAILGCATLGSSRTCLVVLISFGDMVALVIAQEVLTEKKVILIPWRLEVLRWTQAKAAE